MTAQQIRVTPLASLDWPSTLPKGRVQCGTESYLAYKARRENKIPFLHFSACAKTYGSDSDSSIDIMEVIKSKRGNEKEKAAIDLNKLTPDKLENLSYYDILGGIKMHSTPEQVKRAFRQASLKYHPDKKDAAKNSAGGGSEGTNDDNGEDPVFLKVKEAFETLSDAAKRKAYDSTVGFDESIPSSSDIRKESDFYKVFGDCFEKNLRFAAESDPDQAAAAVAKKKLQNKKKGKRGSKNNRGYEGPPSFGDENTAIDIVNEFYEYWIHFQSWRDFTLPATKVTEHDTDMADSRYEKRWMQNEIARQAKAMKKDELARITKLVERSMALDPRLKRERARVEQEKEEKQRLKKEKAANEEKERKEKEERDAKEKAEQEEAEKKQKAEMKLKRDQEKKVLRKAKQALRRLVLAEFESENNRYQNGDIEHLTWTSIDDMNDDVESLCGKLVAVHLDALTKEVSSGKSDGSDINSKLSILQEKAKNMRSDADNARKVDRRKRELLRIEAKKKEAEAKKARASKPWAKEELSALAKAVKKYPAGGANRWETIAVFVNNLCRLEEPRTKEECIEKYNQSATSKPKTVNGNGGTVDATNKSDSSKPTKEKGSGATEWTDEQDKLLQSGLKTFPSSMDKNERWSSIAKEVPGKTKKECVARFKAIRVALKNK